MNKKAQINLSNVIQSLFTVRQQLCWKVKAVFAIEQVEGKSPTPRNTLTPRTL